MESKRKLPQHIAIIPDANRRWAKEKGLKSWEGHEEGAKNIERLVRYANKIGIDCISFWGSSLDNLKKRPVKEKMALLDIYERYFSRLFNDKEVDEGEMKVSVLGRWKEQLPFSVRRTIEKVIKKTKNYKKKKLNFFLAYDGIDEMTEAIKAILRDEIKPEKISSKVIKNHLMTKNLPPVDFLIRTGGEPHLSAGFMMWDIANAQLYFTETKFPDFNEKELEKALKDFSKRGRRFGK